MVKQMKSMLLLVFSQSIWLTGVLDWNLQLEKRHLARVKHAEKRMHCNVKLKQNIGTKKEMPLNHKCCHAQNSRHCLQETKRRFAFTKA